MKSPPSPNNFFLSNIKMYLQKMCAICSFCDTPKTLLPTSFVVASRMGSVKRKCSGHLFSNPRDSDESCDIERGVKVFWWILAHSLFLNYSFAVSNFH